MDCNETLPESRATSGDEDKPWRDGEIISRGHTDRPLPSGLLGQNKAVTAYFISRRDAKKTASKKYSFSMESPHSCIGCRHIVVTDALLRSKDRICLSQDLLTAIHAAQKGCAFFAWLLDLLCDPAEDLLENDLFFGMRYADVAFHLIPDPELDSFIPELNVVADFINPSGNFATGRFGPATGIGFWTDGENPAAPYIEGRPIEVNKNSVRTMGFVRDALQACQSRHAKCRCTEDEDGPETLRPSNLPTRLLHITQGGSFVRLIRLYLLPEADRLEVARQGYASLSYCWGGAQPLQLTPDTSEMLTLGFEANLLPKTLADAAYVTASIGLEYLWIDALCIDQTDDLDKATEISRMALYYGACTVTISAASAAACHEGFLGRGSEIVFENGPFEMAFASPHGGRGTVQIFREPHPTLREPTATRGWTFQETMLSRRAIIFSSNHASWCCNTGVSSSGGTMTQIRGHGADVFATGNTLTSTLIRNPEYAWSSIVEEFMERDLGFECDKLLAIAALAEKADSVQRENNSAQQYVAGLFVDPKSMESWAMGLLWVVQCQSSRRSTTYRAPSWSWAALDGSQQHLSEPLGIPGALDGEYDAFYSNLLDTTYKHLKNLAEPLGRSGDLEEDSLRFKVLDFEVQLTYSHLPFGSVRSARCVVSGLFKRLSGKLEVAVEIPSF